MMGRDGNRQFLVRARARRSVVADSSIRRISFARSAAYPDFLRARFIHIEPLVGPRPAAMAPASRVGIRTDQFDPLVRIVDLDLIAEAGQRGAHKTGQPGSATCAIAIAQYKVGARVTDATFAIFPLTAFIEWQFRWKTFRSGRTSHPSARTALRIGQCMRSDA